MAFRYDKRNHKYLIRKIDTFGMIAIVEEPLEFIRNVIRGPCNKKKGLVGMHSELVSNYTDIEVQEYC